MHMQITRRELIVLTTAAAATTIVGGCGNGPDLPATPPLTREPVNAGAITRFAADTINEDFRDSHGFFVVRSGDHLFALSAICTHKHCKLDAEDGGFRCPCHGALFTREGVVTRAPATKDLPRLAVAANEHGHLIVRTDLPVLAAEQNQSGQGFVTIR
jgi:Rieske Fe-S protein